MTKRSFLRNALMALAVSFVPRVLQPLLPEIMEEEMVDVPVTYWCVGYDPYSGDLKTTYSKEPVITTIKLRKSVSEFLVAEYQSRPNTNL